jgi:hypothetical protein
MKRSKVFGYIKVGAVVAVLAIAAVPMSSLLVAQPQGDMTNAIVDVTTNNDRGSSEIEMAGSSDAVAALMAGNVVGRSRGCSFGLRRPASAFVP